MAIQQAEKEFGKPLDPKAWAVFKNGTPEERQAFQDKVFAKNLGE
ncbi:MAG: hypothetical protein WB630_07405 [Candidatus Acidiferrales bacterium]